LAAQLAEGEGEGEGSDMDGVEGEAVFEAIEEGKVPERLATWSVEGREGIKVCPTCYWGLEVDLTCPRCGENYLDFGGASLSPLRKKEISTLSSSKSLARGCCVPNMDQAYDSD